MNRAISFLVALFLVCPCAAADQGKSPDQSQESFVFGGRETRPGEFPWVVVILNKVVFDSTSFKDDKFNSQSCGGTLIAPSWVLTSAHCLVVINPDRFPTNIPRSPREILVALDVWDLEKEGGTFSEVERIIVHEDFAGTADAPTLGSDIALLKLVETFPDAPTVTLHTGDPLAFGTEHTIVGWGLSDPPGGFEFPAKQQQGEVKIVSNSTCQSLYFGIVEIEDSQICAGDLDTDVCFGDSGGPLLVQDPSPAGEEPGWVQIGITSFGVGCGDPTIPSVFARISSFSDWVAEQMQQTTPFCHLRQRTDPFQRCRALQPARGTNHPGDGCVQGLRRGRSGPCSFADCRQRGLFHSSAWLHDFFEHRRGRSDLRLGLGDEQSCGVGRGPVQPSGNRDCRCQPEPSWKEADRAGPPSGTVNTG